MRRDLLLCSPLAPEVVLSSLEARGREWRESAIPMALREYGVFGVYLRVTANCFIMRIEAQGTDRFELTCKGIVVPEGAGSIVRAKIRQDNPILGAGLLVALFSTVTFLLSPSWAAFGRDILGLFAYAVVGSTFLVVRNQRRHDAEVSEFINILQMAAWPPGSLGAKPLRHG